MNIISDSYSWEYEDENKVTTFSDMYLGWNIEDTLNKSASQAMEFGDALKEDKFKGVTEQLKR